MTATADPFPPADPLRPAGPGDDGAAARERLKKRRRRMAIGFGIGIVILAALGLFLRGRGEPDRVMRADEPLPEIAGDRVGGGTISSSSDRFAGKVLVVNAWATWCTPCLVEQPWLSSLARRYEDRGVVFLGVNHIDKVDEAESWIRDRDVPYPSLADPEGRTAFRLRFLSVPYTAVVDTSGIVRWKVSGPIRSEDELASLIDDVLAQEGSASPAAG